MRSLRTSRRIVLVASICAASGCAAPGLQVDSTHLRDITSSTDGHLARPAQSAGDEMAPVRPAPSMNAASKAARLETYSVTVKNVDVSSLLLALARDANVNIDVHLAVAGKITITAVNQTLPQILARIAEQTDIRFEQRAAGWAVMPDTPIVRHYTIDYVNVARESRGSNNVATQIASAGREVVNTTGGASTAANNNSITSITNVSTNRFWDSLAANVRSLIGADSGDSGRPRGSAEAPQSQEAAASGLGNVGGQAQSNDRSSAARSGDEPAVFTSPETGILTVRASARQQERVREYIDRLMGSARRQVLIEATIAEVQLSNEFQQGVNFSRLRSDGGQWAFQQQPLGPAALATGVPANVGPGGITFGNTASGASLPGGAVAAGATSSLGVLRYLSSGSTLGGVGAAVSLLQSFGKVKVLSSPKLSVLNSQTAVLKVVDNRVYFTIGVQVTPGQAGSAPIVAYTSTPQTVPVGFVMSVTPQIEESGAVTLSVRPTISRIIGYVNDPNPDLARNQVISRIPEIQTREMESVLKVRNGEIAVMGGLMQDAVNDREDSVPGAVGIPLLGNLFKYRNDLSTKTELVIFLRPIQIVDPSIEGDYKSLRGLLPKDNFFETPLPPVTPRAWRPAAQPGMGAPATRPALPEIKSLWSPGASTAQQERNR